MGHQPKVETDVLPSASSDRSIIVEPSQLDILCGKDKRCQTHEGSRRFRLMIQSYQYKYAEASTKHLRMAITKEIYSAFDQSNSRFLKYNEVEQRWEEITPLAARDKISHALRGTLQRKNNLVGGKGGSKSNAKKRQRHHRRNNSDSSESTLDSIFSQATTASCTTAAGELDEGAFSFIDDLVHPLKRDSRGLEEPEEDMCMEPLPIDVAVDLSFLLQESSIASYNDHSERHDPSYRRSLHSSHDSTRGVFLWTSCHEHSLTK